MKSKLVLLCFLTLLSYSIKASVSTNGNLKIRNVPVSIKASSVDISKKPPLLYKWFLVSIDCWQLFVLEQDQAGEWWWISVMAPPAGSYIGVTIVCLDDIFGPESPYNSFNNYC